MTENKEKRNGRGKENEKEKGISKENTDVKEKENVKRTLRTEKGNVREEEEMIEIKIGHGEVVENPNTQNLVHPRYVLVQCNNYFSI